MKKNNFYSIFLTLCIGFLSGNVHSQCNPAGNGTNGGIRCMFNDSVHNCLYIGGGFQNSDTVTLNNCGYWNGSGYLPMSMMGFVGCNDSVLCFTYFNDDLYVGGNFTQAGGVPCNHLARWDGTSWEAVGDGFNQPVHALAVYNNELYAGGDFTLSGTESVNHLGKWNGSQWIQVSTGIDDDVEALCVYNNTLYVGGDFIMAGGSMVNHICRWDGTTISGVGSGFTGGMMGQVMVHSFCVYNGSLYAGGMFEHSGSVDMHNLAMWNGTEWSSIGDIGGAMMGQNVVSALCAYNGELFCGGNFGSCGSMSANNLGKWNGTSWSNIGTGMDGSVFSLAVYQNILYIAGSFSSAAGTPVNNIAEYASTTGIQSVQASYIKLTIFPNPAGDIIQVRWVSEKSSQVDLIVSDVNGRMVFEKKSEVISPGIHQEDIPVITLNNGIYLLTLRTGDKNYSSKFEIAR